MEGQKPPGAVIFAGHAGPDPNKGAMPNPYERAPIPHHADPNVPLKYEPELSFRTLSTTAAVVGITIWVLSTALGNSILSNGLCCATLVSTALLDSVHNVGKRRWLIETDQSSFGEFVNLLMNLFLVPVIVIIFFVISFL